MQLILSFFTKSQVELTQVEFLRSGHEPLVSVRGKSGDRSVDGCFQWTTAVRAFAELAVGTRLSLLGGDEPYRLSGEKGSPAASLDYAISKPTQWIVDLFGSQPGGRPFALRVFQRHNTERKLAGPVSIQLAAGLLEPAALRILLDSRELDGWDDLNILLGALRGEERGEAAPDLPAGESDEWYRQAWFEKAAEEQLHGSLRETTLMEPLALSQARRRLERYGWASESPTVAAAIRQIGEGLPGPRGRYRDLDAKELRALKSSNLRVSVLPLALGALSLLVYLRSEHGLAIELDWSYAGTGEMAMEAPAAGEKGALTLSWGAISKLTQSQYEGRSALMLLPKTAFELVVPKGSSARDVRQVFLAEDPRGYPKQLLDQLQLPPAFFSEPPAAVDASLAEIPSRLSRREGAAICAFPLSRINAKFLGAETHDPDSSDGRVGDNVLLAHGLSPALQKSLCTALRSAWFQLLESPERRSKVIRSLMRDESYISFLKRMGGLYTL